MSVFRRNVCQFLDDSQYQELLKVFRDESSRVDVESESGIRCYGESHAVSKVYPMLPNIPAAEFDVTVVSTTVPTRHW